MPVINTIFQIVLGFLWFIEIAIFVWVVISWILVLSQRSKARWRYRGLFEFLEVIDRYLRLFLGPFLRLARRILPARILPREWQFIDFSPLIVLLLIALLRAVLVWVYGRILFGNPL